jgi:hypothetical protein
MKDSKRICAALAIGAMLSSMLFLALKTPDLDSFQLTVALMAFAIGYAELREILIKNICGKADK